VAINPKKDLALMATSYWKILKTAEKTSLKNPWKKLFIWQTLFLSCVKKKM